MRGSCRSLTSCGRSGGQFAVSVTPASGGSDFIDPQNQTRSSIACVYCSLCLSLSLPSISFPLAPYQTKRTSASTFSSQHCCTRDLRCRRQLPRPIVWLRRNALHHVNARRISLLPPTHKLTLKMLFTPHFNYSARGGNRSLNHRHAARNRTRSRQPRGSMPGMQ